MKNTLITKFVLPLLLATGALALGGLQTASADSGNTQNQVIENVARPESSKGQSYVKPGFPVVRVYVDRDTANTVIRYGATGAAGMAGFTIGNAFTPVVGVAGGVIIGKVIWDHFGHVLNSGVWVDYNLITQTPVGVGVQ
ncbi:hypothetical protein R54876_GBNLAHCA_01066 [Eupransor demetentiae]|uniref:Uncharacterized protein n=2 Tax=Eupransor demetentiae TaxID=3109584 RepID=A0ABM9N5L8_9LACO|nr:hypothetical protein R54876_GBNLAHCA_01066 [Lactobacillaceae bacterium LMG 33000]